MRHAKTNLNWRILLPALLLMILWSLCLPALKEAVDSRNKTFAEALKERAIERGAYHAEM